MSMDNGDRIRGYKHHNPYNDNLTLALKNHILNILLLVRIFMDVQMLKANSFNPIPLLFLDCLLLSMHKRSVTRDKLLDRLLLL